MFAFDMMTSLIIISVSFSLSLILMLLIWKKYRAVIDGTHYFLLYFALMIVGVLLTIFRQQLSNFASIIMSNVIIFIAKLVLLFGVKTFYKLKLKYTYVFLSLFVYTLSFIVFTYLYPSILIRVMINAIALAALHLIIYMTVVKDFKDNNGSIILSAISILSILYYVSRITIMLVTRESYGSIFEYKYDSIIILFEGLIGILTVVGIYDIISSRIFSDRLELERSKNQLLDNIPGFAYRCDFDVDWTMKFISSSFNDITGYDTSEVINNAVLSYGDIIVEEYKEKVFNAFKKGAKENKAVKTEYEITKKNGERIWVWEQAKCLYESNGNVLAIEGHISDISDRKRLEEKNKLLEMQLINQQKLESIGTLAGGVAHEINNPINGILNYGQIIADLTEENTDIHKYAGEIIYETNRVSEIVRNLLDFSRQNGERYRYTDVNEIINKTVSLIKTIYKHDNIGIDIKVQNNISNIKCRAQQIQQVLMNLLTNARDSLNEKYSDYDENKRISIDCNEVTIDRKKWIKIAVKDFGIGINPDIKHRIFDPFFTTKSKDKGTGLGLSISYGIVNEHRGDIKVESKPNEYTVFSVLLPCEIDIEEKIDI